jgi:hypothetical protein
MAANNAQETLDRILGELKSNDLARCRNALLELETLNFSSPAILHEIERLAVECQDEPVQKKAVELLRTSVHQRVRRNKNGERRSDRLFLLKKIKGWQEDGILPAQIAEVLNARYDFDLVASRTAPRSAPEPREASTLPPVASPPAIPDAPRLSLMQTLLSEASIRIYLYLGAFFVIASALILAALVEAARLPILAVATLAFGGTALALRRRLSQPSFALFIVFSFLLPIDANVLKESIGFAEPSLSVYWTVLFFVMALIWGWSVWFYQSRFFSAVAFVSLSLAFYRAAEIFASELELKLFFGILACFMGLAVTSLLQKWKTSAFSQPVFLLAQAQVLGLLLLSLGFATIRVFGFDSALSNGWWFLIGLTWVMGAIFFILSEVLTPLPVFPWLAAAALVPLPWFVLKSFGATEPVYAFAFWAWGTVLVLASEGAVRLLPQQLKKYHWPLLAASVLSFLAALALAFFWDRVTVTFSIYALVALVYLALHLLRPRWYVWSAALLSTLFAYFTLFELPAIARLDIPLVYQVLIASALLVLPELFARSPLALRSEWRAPALGFGTLASLFGLTLALADLDHTGRGSVALIVYAALFILHGIHGKREWLGYFGAAAGSLALVYALDHFHLDLWLQALALLATLYYAAGFFLRRLEETPGWGTVLINSGLVLGGLLSLTSLLVTRETSGWYIILIAFLFAVETFARPLVWLELAVEALLSIALYEILNDFNITRISHFLFGASLIWLGGDLLFQGLIHEKRFYRLIVIGAGGILAFMNTFVLLGELNPPVPAIYFFLYAAFFTLYALRQAEPLLGYLPAFFLALALNRFCEVVGFEKWIFPLIALAMLYYAAGYWLRLHQRAKGWDQILLYSGLGLGILVSVAAVFLGGLDSSIPVAIAATLFALEAFALRKVWWALPANLLYLMSYFMILLELDVAEPQFYSVGAALLGMLMHYLLTRAGSKTGAFIAGMLSQLVLLGTTYIQMVSTERLSFFFVLFAQAMLVLIYGLIQRSRSLVITPIAFAVIGVMTVVYSALKGLGPVILIGTTGVVLLSAGIVAVLMRERITRLGEQLSDWKP